MILTLAGKSQRLSHMCTWKSSDVFNRTRCWFSAPSNLAMAQLRCEQVNLLGSCVPVKGMRSERNVCEAWLRDGILLKLTCSLLSGFIAQSVRGLHRHRRAHGFESCWRHLKLSRAHMRQSLRLSSKCEDHFLNSSLNRISQTFFSLNGNDDDDHDKTNHTTRFSCRIGRSVDSQGPRSLVGDKFVEGK